MTGPTAEERASRVYESCAALIRRTLARHWNAQGVPKLADQIAGILDRELTELSQSGKPLDCKVNCTFCCHRMITAEPIELTRIWSVVEQWPLDKKTALQQRIESYYARADRDREENFRRYRAPCAFLTDGKCSIYEHRPAMCRTACSQTALLCEDLHEDLEALRAYSPNGEAEILRAALTVMLNACRPFGPTVYLQLSHVIGCLLDEPARFQELLTKPSIFSSQVQPPWDLRLAPPTNDPLAGRGLQGEAAASMSRRSGANLNELFRQVKGNSTAEYLARIDCPEVYRSEDEIAEWRAYWERSIEEALDHEPWDALDAYHDLIYLRPVKAGYASLSMRAPMQKIGQLVCEKTARRVSPELCDPPPRRKPGKARFGIIGNIGATAGTVWSIGWIRNLNKTRVESYVLDVGAGDDAICYAFKDAAYQYLHLRGDPLQIAHHIRSLDLDYLVFCDIGDERGIYQLGCFRLARRQAAAWGCPFTSGLPTMDDYISFDLMEAPNAQQEYSENLVRLPGIGLCLSPPTPNRVNWGREEFGLPSGFLASFPQHSVKWLPNRDWVLAKIAEKTKNPVVMMRSGASLRQEVIERRMERAKVPVLWMNRQQKPLFLRLLSSCDVALDAPDWSGGLTAIDCFTQKTPFITLPGPYFRHRLGVGIARMAGGNGLIASNPEDYVDLSTNQDRIREAMQSVDPARLYGDLAPVRALEEHVMRYVP